MSIIGDIVGKITGAQDAADAAQQAGQTQAASAQAGIDETRRQFDALIKLMAPFVTAGTGALGAQQNLIGMGGDAAQKAAIASLEQGPQFQAQQQLGEDALRQNAAATGGLRGGNLQAALAQFRPQLLAQLIQQQYGNLGGLSQLGQAAAAGQASAGLQTGTNVANLLSQQGAALAGGQVAQGGVARQGFGDLLRIGGTVAGLSGGFGGFGGRPAPLQL